MSYREAAAKKKYEEDLYNIHELCLLLFPICICLWKSFNIIPNVFLFLSISTGHILKSKLPQSHLISYSSLCYGLRWGAEDSHVTKYKPMRSQQKYCMQLPGLSPKSSNVSSILHVLFLLYAIQSKLGRQVLNVEELASACDSELLHGPFPLCENVKLLKFVHLFVTVFTTIPTNTALYVMQPPSHSQSQHHIQSLYIALIILMFPVYLKYLFVYLFIFFASPQLKCEFHNSRV